MARLSHLQLPLYVSLICCLAWLYSGRVAAGSIGGRREEIKLNSDGGYEFLVAIHEDVKEDPELLTKLQVSDYPDIFHTQHCPESECLPLEIITCQSLSRMISLRSLSSLTPWFHSKVWWKTKSGPQMSAVSFHFVILTFSLANDLPIR